MTTNGISTVNKECETEKDLGVTFDNKLSFDSHIQSCINKSNSMIGVIKRTFQFLDRDTFIKLYKALVRPHLEYGNVIWYPQFKRQSVAIERVQRRATKLLPECRGMTYEERLNYLNLHSLKGRRVRGDLIEAFKLYNGLVDGDWNLFFTNVKYTNTRGSEGKIYVKHCNLNLRKNTFSSRILKLWNNLGSQLKNAQSTNSFKNQLDCESKFVKLFRDFD